MGSPLPDRPARRKKCRRELRRITGPAPGYEPGGAAEHPPLLTEALAELLADRTEALIASGRVELVDHPADVRLARGPAVTAETLAAILAALLPEAFEGPVRSIAPPSAHPPGSDGRIAEMTGRVERGESPWSKLDPDMIRNDRLGSTGDYRGNGIGVRVAGWAEDEDGET